MTADQLRRKFISFFISKGHTQIKSAPLVPENDPTILFTTAGMHPLVPFLLGERHPAGKLLTNIQKCLRTDDIEEVGDNCHNTFFEMLGYWSLGDYWKSQSIHYTFDFYTHVLGFDKEKISVSVFAGDRDAPFDKESYNIWKNEIEIPTKQIYKYPKSENWWGPAGETGPCGPCTEMFIDTGSKSCGKNCGPSCTCGKFVEIGNNVFMEYNKQQKYKYISLKQKNVDVGFGLERLLMLVNKKSNIYETELFKPLMDWIKNEAKKYNIRGARIISDHIRASVFLIADGVEPSNLDQGYILRRLIRRIIRHANLIEIYHQNYLAQLAKIVIKNYHNTYPEIDKEKEIITILNKEKEKFERALEQGEREFAKVVSNLRTHNQEKISGRVAFKLYESYGMPLEMIEEMAHEQKIKLDKAGFEKAFRKHQLLSRKGAQQKFKGGLADNSEIVTRYHTATHLLHQALHQVLGNHVEQKGSNITAERLRFDFTHKEKMTNEQKKKVEDLVNEQIKKSLPVTTQEMDLKSAKASGALGFFESKYGKIVKVYTIGGPSTRSARSGRPFSVEICGGPHVKNTKELGKFSIKREESSSSGVRRIKAVLE